MSKQFNLAANFQALCNTLIAVHPVCDSHRATEKAASDLITALRANPMLSHFNAQLGRIAQIKKGGLSFEIDMKYRFSDKCSAVLGLMFTVVSSEDSSAPRMFVYARGFMQDPQVTALRHPARGGNYPRQLSDDDTVLNEVLTLSLRDAAQAVVEHLASFVPVNQEGEKTLLTLVLQNLLPADQDKSVFLE